MLVFDFWVYVAYGLALLLVSVVLLLLLWFGHWLLLFCVAGLMVVGCSSYVRCLMWLWLLWLRKDLRRLLGWLVWDVAFVGVFVIIVVVADCSLWFVVWVSVVLVCFAMLL